MDVEDAEQRVHAIFFACGLPMSRPRQFVFHTEESERSTSESGYGDSSNFGKRFFERLLVTKQIPFPSIEGDRGRREKFLQGPPSSEPAAPS